MTALYLLEPEDPGPAWAPFSGVRPLAELRAGIWRVRERWEAAIGTDAEAILGSHAAGFHEADEPPTRSPDRVHGPAVVAASWFAPTGAALELGPEVRRLTHEGATVGWVVPDGAEWDRATSGPRLELEGIRLQGTYDLLRALEHFLAADCGDFLVQVGEPVPDGSIVLGDPSQIVILGAQVEPGVVFDVRKGAIVMEEGVEVRSGSRLEGPLYVGPGTLVLGGYFRESAFGPQCRVRGEIVASVFLGYANKSHDGFLGHSVVGRWVNLGALTTTSNLKNTYGPVHLQVAEHRIETGRMYLGSLLGDHAKTAIGTMLSTGTVVSVGANIFGKLTPPKFVPPFAWGDEGTMSEEGFLRTAQRVLPRRNVEFTPERRESLRLTYSRLAAR